MNEPPKSGRAGRCKRTGSPESLDPHGEIGSKLKALFAEVEREPIPSGLMDLLEQLAEAERRHRK